MGVQGAPPKASPSLPVICPPRDRSVHRLVLRTKPSLCWLVAVASGTRYLGGGPDGNEGLSEESGSLMDGGASRGGGRTVAWPSPTVRPRAGCCPRPQFPACATGRRGRDGTAARWPPGLCFPLALSQRPRAGHQPPRHPRTCSQPEPSPRPRGFQNHPVRAEAARLPGAPQTATWTDRHAEPALPHHQPKAGRASGPGRAPLGSSRASAQSVLLGVRGAVGHAGRGRGPPGVPGPPLFEGLVCSQVHQEGPLPTGRPVAVVRVGEGSGTLRLRGRQLVSGRCLRALPEQPIPKCQDAGATARLWSSLLCDLGQVIEPLCLSFLIRERRTLRACRVWADNVGGAGSPSE